MKTMNSSINTKEVYRSKIKKSFIGITLIEIAIGLALAAVVVAVAYRGYEQNMSRNQIIEDSKLIVEIISDTINYFGPSSKFGELNTSVVVTSGVIPPRYVNKSENPPKAINQYGGDILVEPIAVSDTFAFVRYEKVPKRNCMGVVMMLAPSVQGIAVRPLVDTSKPSTVTEASDWNVKAFGTSSTVNLEVLTEACKDASTSDVNIIVGFSKN